jgi:hypothetical protein
MEYLQYALSIYIHRLCRQIRVCQERNSTKIFVSYDKKHFHYENYIYRITVYIMVFNKIPLSVSFCQAPCLNKQIRPRNRGSISSRGTKILFLHKVQPGF